MQPTVSPDKEIDAKVIGQILRKIFLDTNVTQSSNYFINHTYRAEDFSGLVEAETFKRIVGFLPNVKYKGKPFILSVTFNKKKNNFEVIVHNPNMKY